MFIFERNKSEYRRKRHANNPMKVPCCIRHNAVNSLSFWKIELPEMNIEISATNLDKSIEMTILCN